MTVTPVPLSRTADRRHAPGRDSAPHRPNGTEQCQEQGSEMNNAFGQKTPPPRAASTVYFSMDGDGDVLAARPTPLVEVRPQQRVQRHTAEQIIQTFVPAQVLDAPVLQMGNQLVEFMQKLDTATPEQVIDVPNLSQDRIPQRSAVGRPQTAEQLVEVPTVLSFSSLQQQSVEQIIDVPVPHRRRRGQGGLQGFPSDRIQQHGLWSSTWTFQFLVVEGDSLIFKVSP